MSFRLKIKHYLIHRLNYTNKLAGELISSGNLTVNGKNIVSNIELKESDEVHLNGVIVKHSVKFVYYALYKPIGIESVFDKKRVDSLYKIWPVEGEFYVAGRLDKSSEGLLIITNNGKWVNEVTSDLSLKEKDYEVEVEHDIDGGFLKKMSEGVDIGICITKPCRMQMINNRAFKITLTEGKNRQIRRMCKKLGYSVIRLKRIRIDKFYLLDLKPFEYREVFLT